MIDKKKLLSGLLLATVGVVCAYPLVSRSAEGWDFAVDSISVSEKSGEQGYRVCARVANNSTNPSYKCPDCTRGCGTVNVRFDAKNPDAGAIRGLSTGKRAEICNGDTEQVCFDNDDEPHRWGAVEMTVTLTSPGGGSFDRETRLFRF